MRPVPREVIINSSIDQFQIDVSSSISGIFIKPFFSLFYRVWLINALPTLVSGFGYMS